MRRLITGAIILSAAALAGAEPPQETATSAAAPVATAPPPLRQSYAPERLVVRFRPEAAEKIPDRVAADDSTKLPAPLRELRSAGRLASGERLFRSAAKSGDAAFSGVFVLEFSGGPEGRALEELRRHPDVVYAHEDALVSVALAPTDPGYPAQWGLHNTGQVYPSGGSYNAPPGTPDADIDAPEAWGLQSTSGEVVVAIIDTGVDYTHRDLASAMWINQAEQAGSPGVDDDGNGFVDDVYGYDFVKRNQNRDSDPDDDHGHGTHCAGIVAAVRNNGMDAAGIASNARIMAVRALDSTGEGFISDAAEAIVYAADNGADVLSNSWGAPSSLGYDVLNDALSHAASAGCVIVAAAGNDDRDYVTWPAFHPDVIGVTATDSNDTQAPFTNYGAWLDVAAPGVDVYNLRAEGTSRGFVQDDYTTVLSGTSMSTPFVAGVAALVLGEDPALTPDEVRGLLKATSDPMTATEYIGQGRVNAHAALASIGSTPVARLEWADFRWNEVLSSGLVELSGTATAPDFDRYEIWWGEGVAPTAWNLAITENAPVEDGVLTTEFNTVRQWEGLYSIRLSVYDQSGLRADSAHLINIVNYEHLHPMHNDVLRLTGEPLPVRFRIPDGTNVEQVSWGEDHDPAVWMTDGVTMQDGTDDLWAMLDTSQFGASTLLNLRLGIETPFGPRTEYIEMFWLDERLKPGFPAFFPKLTDSTPYEHHSDLVVEDHDGDGQYEMVVVNSITDSAVETPLLIFGSDGQLLETRTTGDGGIPWSDKPLVANLDGASPGRDLVAQLGNDSVHAWTPEGEPADGAWPARVFDSLTQKVLADLDRDGNMELFFDSGGFRELTVVGHDGTVLVDEPLETISHGFEPSPFPSVGQFDDDPELEIAIRHGLTQVAVMDPDGTLLPGWPVECTGFVGGLAVGDVDDDGQEELVVLAGENFQTGIHGDGLYVFERDGQLTAPSPAALADENRLFTAPSLADMDGDGDLEIIFTSYGRIYIFHHTGEAAAGWPGHVTNAWFWRGVQIADITGDGQPDIVAAGGGMNSNFSRGASENYSSGVRAWRYDGSVIDLNPHPDHTAIYLPDGTWRRSATLADIDDNGMLDLVVSSFWEVGYGTKSRSVSKERSAIYAFELPVQWNPHAAPWPMPMKNPRSSANFSGIDAMPLATIAPVLLPEPAASDGTSNTIEWEPLDFADEYYAEADDDADFSSPLASSGWTADTTHTFNGLPANREVHFRVRGRYETSLRTVETVWSDGETTTQRVPQDMWQVK